jgi:beta-glucanase (GH16 family)
MKRACFSKNTNKHVQPHASLASLSPSGFIRPLKINFVRMKIKKWGFYFLLFVATQAWGQESKYKLIWADEFDYSGDPNPKYWTREVMASPPNNELENYTNSSKNSFVKNGSLFIRTIKETLGGKNYTSARLITSGKVDWTYGKIEVRAKIPLGKGTWPAIWLLYYDDPYGGWPNSGEIDIMEHVGYDPGNIHGSAHGNVYNPLAGHTVKTSTYKVNNVTDFHVYACEWNKDSVKFFADGYNYYTVTNEHKGWQKWPFDHNFFLILNNAFGGDWGGAQGIDNTIFKNDSSVQMEVDYVRLYKKCSDFPIVGKSSIIENTKG